MDKNVYKVLINDIENENIENYNGMLCISLVESPATMIPFLKFNSETEKESINFKIESEDKRILCGPLMLADVEIERINKKTGEKYYVTFPEETLDKMVQKWSKEKRINKINLNHNPEQEVSGVYLQEIWKVIDPQNDKSKALGFEGITKGSYMISYFVEDVDFWNNEIKDNNKFNGFSLEVFADLILQMEQQFKKEEFLDERSLLQRISILIKENDYEQRLIDKIKQSIFELEKHNKSEDYVLNSIKNLFY